MNKTYTYGGITYASITDLCTATGTDTSLVRDRLKHDWLVCDAIELPRSSAQFLFVGKDQIGRFQYNGEIITSDQLHHVLNCGG